MARYIDAEELQEEIKTLSVMLGGNNVFKTAKESVLRIIDEQPTADVVEVKHGEWLRQNGGFFFLCSACGKAAATKGNYCHDCGTLMDGGS